MLSAGIHNIVIITYAVNRRRIRAYTVDISAILSNHRSGELDMAEESKPVEILLDSLDKRLKVLDDRSKRTPWLGLLALGGPLVAISLAYIPDTSGWVVGSIGIVLCIAGILLYMAPWYKG
jgi:hypothetical protein